MTEGSTKKNEISVTRYRGRFISHCINMTRRCFVTSFIYTWKRSSNLDKKKKNKAHFLQSKKKNIYINDQSNRS